MAKKKNAVQVVGKAKITPDMFNANPNAVPSDIRKAVTAIGKAQANVESSGATIAYYLNVMSKTSATDKDPLYKRLGYSTFAEYAQDYHNISDSTCRVYKSAAVNIVRDKLGIHSKFATFAYDETGETPTGIESDFTVSQLVELCTVPPYMVKKLLETNRISHNTRTKLLRNVKVMTKKLLDGKKASAFTSVQLDTMCERIAIANMLIATKSLNVDGALEYSGKVLNSLENAEYTDERAMLMYDDIVAKEAKAKQEAQNAAPNGEQNAAPNGEQNAAPNGEQNAAPNGEQNAAPNGEQNAAPIADYASAYRAFEKAFDALMEFATEIDTLSDLNERILSMAETVETEMQNCEDSPTDGGAD